MEKHVNEKMDGVCNCNEKVEDRSKDPKAITFDKYDPKKKWKPEKDDPPHKLCLLAAYRDSNDPRTHGKGRQQQLKEFREKMKPLMAERNVEYIMIVSEQEQGLIFNKGLTFNAGFLMGYQKCDYFIFHDIDMFPVFLNNTYEYPATSPVHMVSSSQLWLMQKDIAGGVLAMSHEQYIASGGFSNAFWGWGYEDDDIFFRMRNMGLNMTRLPLNVGYYQVLEHERHDYYDLLEKDQTIVSHAYSLLSRDGRIDYKKEGLRTANATLLSIVEDSPDYFHFIYRPHNRFNLLEEEIFQQEAELGFGAFQNPKNGPIKRATVIRP